MVFYGGGIVKGFAWIQAHWGAAAVNLVSVFMTALITKYVETGDLWWLKAIWLAVWGAVVGAYDWFFSSVPVPVWLLLPVVGLALIPVWHLVQSIRFAEAATQEPPLTESQLKVLDFIQSLEETRAGSALPESIAMYSGLTRLVVDVAIDNLSHRGYINSFRQGSCSMTTKGRAYLLENYRVHISDGNV